MVNLRKFIISGSIFDKYETDINLDIIDSIEEIIKIIKKRIENDIRIYPEIFKIFINIDFHIHDYSIADILLSEHNKIFYVCSFCNKDNTIKDNPIKDNTIKDNPNNDNEDNLEEIITQL